MYEEYIPPDDDDIKKIWKESTIVFDTNILLHLYRYNKPLRERLLKILSDKNICDRIWIPAKVYEEFLKNRANVLSEQWSREDTMDILLKELIKDFNKKIQEKFSNKNYHPYIDVSNIEKGLKEFVEK
jgi:predicted nucleic acid-binding protein